MNSARCGVDFFVDLDQLTQLGQEIQSLINMLDGVARGPVTDRVAMGSGEVADAVHRFTSRWQFGRQQMIDELSDALTHVQLAIDSYSKTEVGLRAGLQPAVGTTSSQPASGASSLQPAAETASIGSSREAVT